MLDSEKDHIIKKEIISAANDLSDIADRMIYDNLQAGFYLELEQVEFCLRKHIKWEDYEKCAFIQRIIETRYLKNLG